jgi:hypothetical protein
MIPKQKAQASVWKMDGQVRRTTKELFTVFFYEDGAVNQ